ncbi:MAG: hypothetical protein AAFX79_07905 [Planctomycetota bacterium]
MRTPLLSMLLSTLLLPLACYASPATDAQASDPVVRALTANGATLSTAIGTLEDLADADPGRARLALGMARFFRGGERVVQTLHRYGAGEPLRTASFLFARQVMQIAQNPEPERISADDVRAMIQRWIDDLRAADADLATVDLDGDPKLTIDLAQLPMDLNGDGVCSPREEPASAFAALFRGGVRLPEGQDSFVLGIDAADVHWMRAYCHVMMAAGEMLLAYDNRDMFHRCGHLFFPNVASDYPFLQQKRPLDFTGTQVDFGDVAAFVGSLRFPLAEGDGAARTRRARTHLLEAIGHSRAMWAAAKAETDNDREWLPAPHQSSALSQVRITEQRVAMWLDLLDELEAVLEGRALVRFWRGDGTRGINLRRALDEPRDFDLFYWVQGSAAAPYLEDATPETPFTRERLWADMERAFGDDLIWSLFYIN